MFSLIIKSQKLIPAIFSRTRVLNCQVVTCDDHKFSEHVLEGWLPNYVPVKEQFWQGYLQSASVLIQHSLLSFDSQPVNVKWGGLDWLLKRLVLLLERVRGTMVMSSFGSTWPPLLLLFLFSFFWGLPAFLVDVELSGWTFLWNMCRICIPHIKQDFTTQDIALIQ